jgi:hypothetical protein
MRYFRFWLGRLLVHAGLRVMPPGMVKAELYELFWDWGRNCREVVERYQRG